MSSKRNKVRDVQESCDLFDLPKEGTYLEEAENGQRNPLMNEDWDDPDSIAGDDVPVRILRNFYFFDPHSLRLISLTSLSEDHGFCEGFGWALVNGDVEDQGESDHVQDSGILLHLSNILKWSLDINQERIWVVTQYAWYILQVPSSEYRQFFVPFYTKEMLLRVVLRNISKNPELSPQEFFRLLSLPTARDYLLNRCWTQEDFATNFRYSQQELQNIICEIPGLSWENIGDKFLLRALLCDSQEPRSPNLRRTHKNSRSKSQSSIRSVTPSPAVRPRKQKLKKSTTITPIVDSLISSFFNVEFTVVGQKPDFLEEGTLLRERPDNRIVTEFSDKLKPGEFVLINEGDHWDQSQIRFAQIICLRSKRKVLHVRWFIHGSCTMLEELAFEQEIFLSVADGCKDVSVDCVVGKCDVVRLSLKERSHLEWPAKNMYFFSSAWDRNNPTDFVEVKDDQIHVPSSSFCNTCDSKSISPLYHLSGSSITIKHQEYHKYDFVRYQSTETDLLTCSFGQITSFSDHGGTLRIDVFRLGRMNDTNKKSFCIENELFMTPIVVTVDASMILGMCQVTHISQFENKLTDYNWLDQHPLSFYVQYQAESLESPLLTLLPPNALHVCDICVQNHITLENLHVQCRKEVKLRAFDPFIGCGGFGLGLARGCSMQTTHGVELNSSIAETMRMNFPPGTIMINKDATQVLKHVVQGRDDVPQRGEVDLIYSGPPCQNDSTLNRHKTDRKCLAFTALSFVEVLRPPYFIMESVPGLLQREVRNSPHKLRAGELKLIIKVLHFLGYNVMGRLLHARSFGDPQTRTRFFIVATLPEYGDFYFPEATHAFKRGQVGILTAKLGDFKLKAAVARPGCALHETVTVSEALSDLPLFDWTSPEDSKPPRKADGAPHSDSVIKVACDIDESWGIPDSTFQYNSPPANVFQHRARRNLGLSNPKYQHFTKTFGSYVVRNVCDIPLVPTADYRHLKQENREWSIRDPASAKAIQGFQSGAYTRLDPDGYFHTIVTNVGPTAKQSRVLHPAVCILTRFTEWSKRIDPDSQCKRILTVRELARAQGFPDDFVFYSETGNINDYHEEIGNSVSFGVSAALGRSIQELVFRRWSHNGGESL